MAALLAAESIRLVAGAATELSNADLVQCTEKFIQKLDQGHNFSNDVIQEAVDGSAKLFRTSFNRFSVDALPCIWNDLGLADFPHSTWKQILQSAGHTGGEPQEPSRKFSWSGSRSSCNLSVRSDESQGRCHPAAACSSTSGQSSLSGSCGSVSSQQVGEADLEKCQLLEQVATQQRTISMLTSLVASSQTKLAETTVKLKKTQRSKRIVEKQLAQSQQELADEKVRRLHDLAITKTSDMFKKRKVNPKQDAGENRNTWEWLTPQGSLALGIRRNFSNIASGDLGITLCDDISRWTVVRNEIRVAACMIAGSRNFFRCWKMAASVDGRTISSETQPVTILSFRQDGTNSGIWNKSKLIALELEASYRIDIPLCLTQTRDGITATGFHDDDVFPNWQRLKRLADVQIVKDGSGLASLALTQKMLDSLGCPHWGNICTEHGSPTSGGQKQLSQLGRLFYCLM